MTSLNLCDQTFDQITNSALFTGALGSFGRPLFTRSFGFGDFPATAGFPAKITGKTRGPKLSANRFNRLSLQVQNSPTPNMTGAASAVVFTLLRIMGQAFTHKAVLTTSLAAGTTAVPVRGFYQQAGNTLIDGAALTGVSIPVTIWQQVPTTAATGLGAPEFDPIDYGTLTATTVATGADKTSTWTLVRSNGAKAIPFSSTRPVILTAHQQVSPVLSSTGASLTGTMTAPGGVGLITDQTIINSANSAIVDTGTGGDLDYGAVLRGVPANASTVLNASVRLDISAS